MFRAKRSCIETRVRSTAFRRNPALRRCCTYQIEFRLKAVLRTRERYDRLGCVGASLWGEVAPHHDDLADLEAS